MKYSLFLIAATGFIGLAATFYRADVPAAATAVPATVSKPGDLIVHEWGTFTSIAGQNGVALDWRPLNGPSDLPGFVYSSTSDKKGFRGTFGPYGKGQIARVRMETPVIYFYTKDEMEVDVRVGFPKGTVTEWYPQASSVNKSIGDGDVSLDAFSTRRSGITWGKIKLLPNDKPDYMRETADSHYYPARETDSVPVQVCNADKTRIQKEKFLFYRGIGNFDLPLKVRIDGDKLILGTTQDKYGPKSNPGRNITNAIVFENRAGRIGYELVPTISGNTPVMRPELNKTIGDLYSEFERILVSQGLYVKEARAMIETWKDSWFEEGLRVFYILPRLTTDEVLPLAVQPRPTETVRVLVGRGEVITPGMERDVRRQVSLLTSPSAETRKNAEAALKQHGRFYEPILRSILTSETDRAVRKTLKRLISAA